MFLDPRFWLSVSFLIFVALVIKYLLPKIIAALDNKSKQIADEIEQAIKMKIEAEQLLLKTKKYHEESVVYCQKLINEARQEAEKLLIDSNRELAEELLKKTNLAKDRILQEQERSIRDVKSQIISAAIKIIEERSVSLPNQTSLEIVKRAVTDISKMVN